jgi:hypothetical protein
MNPLTREQKLVAFVQLEKIPNVKRGTAFADELANTVELRVPHPMAGRPWKLLGPSDIPGFWHVSSSVPIGLDYDTERMDYQRFELLLPDTDFRRIQ